MAQSNEQFRCEACGTTFNSQQELEQHGKQEHQKQ
ncbi:MAG: C2H2-type zinc finger protein [Thermoproteota archaeon]|nr:C2H2-type zinc finger protein [Thermoproteota archaeon]